MHVGLGKLPPFAGPLANTQGTASLFIDDYEVVCVVD